LIKAMIRKRIQPHIIDYRRLAINRLRKHRPTIFHQDLGGIGKKIATRFRVN
jgi:hypothetical protein